MEPTTASMGSPTFPHSTWNFEMLRSGSLKKISCSFYADEKAAEVTELGIVLALIVAGSIALIAAIGPKIAANYSSVNDKLP